MRAIQQKEIRVGSVVAIQDCEGRVWVGGVEDISSEVLKLGGDLIVYDDLYVLRKDIRSVKELMGADEVRETGVLDALLKIESYIRGSKLALFSDS